MGNAESKGQTGSSSSSSSSHVSHTSTQSNGVGTATLGHASSGAAAAGGGGRKPAATEVYLNIYEPAAGQTSLMPGFGVYHTGIEFGGVEYCFAGGPDAGEGTGVQSQQPRMTPDNQWKFKEAILLGHTHMTYSQLEHLLSEIRDMFPANSYDLVHRNCNIFTRYVAKRLNLEKKYPGWVNRAASWGSVFSATPKHLKPLTVPEPKKSVFESSKGYRLDGSATVGPKDKKSEQKKAEESDKKKAGGSQRKNPWKDPNFLPPSMKKEQQAEAAQGEGTNAPPKAEA